MTIDRSNSVELALANKHEYSERYQYKNGISMSENMKISIQHATSAEWKLI